MSINLPKFLSVFLINFQSILTSIFNLSFNITQFGSKYLENPFNINLILEFIFTGLPLSLFLDFKLSFFLELL